MSRKTNTLLFILLGTIFNIIITISFFIFFLIIYSKFLFGRLDESATAWLLPVFFVAAIVVSFLVYRLAIKILIKKVDMEKYFDPIFSRKPSRKS